MPTHDARIWRANASHQPKVQVAVARCICPPHVHIDNLAWHTFTIHPVILACLLHCGKQHCLTCGPWNRHVPTAVLSRQTAGLRGKSLILNLPGKPKAIRETIDEVRQATASQGPEVHAAWALCSLRLSGLCPLLSGLHT